MAKRANFSANVWKDGAFPGNAPPASAARQKESKKFCAKSQNFLLSVQPFRWYFIILYWRAWRVSFSFSAASVMVRLRSRARAIRPFS